MALVPPAGAPTAVPGKGPSRGLGFPIPRGVGVYQSDSMEAFHFWGLLLAVLNVVFV